MESRGKELNFSNAQLARLIGPLLAEQFLAIAVGLADSMMVASVGDAAISAVPCARGGAMN